MTVDANRVLSMIDERIDGIAKRPRMWGGPEALELQMLQLLEFRSMVGRPVLASSPDEVRTLWWSFINEKAGRPFNSPLFVLFDVVDAMEFGKVLGEFADHVRSRLPLDG